MRRQGKVEPGLFRVEVWFDEDSETVQIKRTDVSVEHQHLSCTFEQWEQIKYAVEHLFEPVADRLAGYDVLRQVARASRN
jgi:uncharacterized protein (DUF2141 family)